MGEKLMSGRWLRDPYRRFRIGLLSALFLGLLYPISLWLSLPEVRDLGYYLKIELSWTFAAVVLLPIAIGLSFAVFDTRLLRIQRWDARLAAATIVLGPLAIILGAVLMDAGGIPGPDRIHVRSDQSIQEKLVRLDVCLRNGPISNCHVPGVPALSASQLSTCANGSGDDLDRSIFKNDLAFSALTEPLQKKLVYYCEMRRLLTSQGLTEDRPVYSVASRTFVSYAAILLNFLLVGSIWLMIVWLAYFGFRLFKKTPLPTISVFACWLGVMSLWFPLRIYSETLLWYGDMSHILAYPAFLVLAAVAIALALHITFWLLVQTDHDVVKSLSGVYGLALILFTVVSLAFRDMASGTILVVWGIPWPFMTLLGFVVLGAVAIYTKLIVDQYAKTDIDDEGAAPREPTLGSNDQKPKPPAEEEDG